MSSNNQQSMKKQKVVVVGNGMVGHHFVEQLAQLRISKSSHRDNRFISRISPSL